MDAAPGAASTTAPDAHKRQRIEGTVKKRKPIRPSASRSDIYVTRERRKFSGQVRRARKLLLDRQFPHITIHGLGAAIEQAIKLSNTVKASLGDQVTTDVTTDTVTLYDDVIPEDGSKDVVTQARQSSAIHIKMSLVSTVKQQLNSNM
ncbi:hypothetical protein GQ54DRAFT_221951 [Martensiomyces pterosporus]|nr:hypothetical protein GQ54DRAFT_221951 [Martensiomyces pterosporus]